MAPFLIFVSLTFAVTWILFLAAVKIPGGTSPRMATPISEVC
jgi:hypothetical protein